MTIASIIPVATGLALLVAGVVFTGCNKSKIVEKDSAASAQDWVDISDTSPEERTYLEYARGVVQAVSSQDYTAFYGHLSSHARARMSLNQFAPADDESVFARQEKQPEKAVALPRFIELMQQCETRFGRPITPLNLHVHTTDAAPLSGTKHDGTDGIDTMFAIGNMPGLASAAIRKASLRAKIQVELSATQLAETAKAHQVTVEELQKDDDFAPYLTLKLVLVAGESGLQVGYFEFLPPSMLD
jgi:hypothetical protein